MKYLTYEEMEKLTTKRLLAYKKKRLSLKQEPKCNSWCNCFSIGNFDICEKNCGKEKLGELIRFKTAYDNIRKILATREHVQ